MEPLQPLFCLSQQWHRQGEGGSAPPMARRTTLVIRIDCCDCKIMSFIHHIIPKSKLFSAKSHPKCRKSHLRNCRFQNFPGRAYPRTPLERLAPSPLACCPPSFAYCLLVATCFEQFKLSGLFSFDGFIHF